MRQLGLQEIRQNQQREHQEKLLEGLSGWLHDFSQVWPTNTARTGKKGSTSKKRHLGDSNSCGHQVACMTFHKFAQGKREARPKSNT